jgi:hypothetical protein
MELEISLHLSYETATGLYRHSMNPKPTCSHPSSLKSILIGVRLKFAGSIPYEVIAFFQLT